MSFFTAAEVMAPDGHTIQAVYRALTLLQNLIRTKNGLAVDYYTRADAYHIIRQLLHEIQINDSGNLKQ